ncbi:Hsp70 family protein [Actinophytocola algeriensis]|uniref:Molecular chaperone DnaK (HSP70) n=1 Tax=Actinophytocola algeriensis TaxID=1768010 RepID=A0A7W7Q1V8_9PSEU|nr:Hsp70 family protein [Actinophytocola algeriensis]MBB4905480.1 molecular chaperone DnaK (HSP70) [Actinophytocola algeriensis]MBE1472835.1 molecular chaperone DnaK (HSP70) [Actinophytocola algeriensis]
MSYRVGIDFGTTFTATAVHRDGEQAAEVVPLGDGRPAVPSVVFVAEDGSFVMGDAAVRRAVTDPDRVVREVKRRIGDRTPVLVAGEPIEAHVIAACFVRWVVDRVTEREGGPPATVVLSHPASWGRHKCELMIEALAGQGVSPVRLVTEPAAAAVAYTASRHVAPGTAIGVYDLGGGTFDATVVRQLDEGGFELTGTPQGIESLGGVDFDEAVFEQVKAIVGTQWTDLDFTDPLVRTAAATLRRECTEAKEALSSDTEVTIPVMLPGVSTRVRMVRTEFEQLVAPAIAATVAALRTACESAGSPDLSAVLLVGGSSRIPLVSQLVSAAFDRPVTVDSDPKAVVACGAALSVRPASPSARTEVLAPVVAVPAFRSRRAVTLGVGIAMCLGALVVTAGTVGTDLLPGGPSPVGVADPIPTDGPRDVVDRSPVGTPQEGEEDPWTGEPYRETTPPGPKRPGAQPTKASPATLTPTPTTGGDRDAEINGAPPTGQPVNPGSSVPPTGPGSSVPDPGPVSSDPPSQDSSSAVPEPEPEPSSSQPDPEPDPDPDPPSSEPPPEPSSDPPPADPATPTDSTDPSTGTTETT